MPIFRNMLVLLLAMVLQGCALMDAVEGLNQTLSDEDAGALGDAGPLASDAAGDLDADLDADPDGARDSGPTDANGADAADAAPDLGRDAAPGDGGDVQGGGADGGPGADADTSGGDVGSEDVGPEDGGPGDGGHPPGSNGCGGEQALAWMGRAAVPGDACGSCGDGELVCDGPEALRCANASERNACLGCASLAGAPASACLSPEGAVGQWTCSGPDEVNCVLSGQNACSGSATLGAVPGTACGPCLGGVWACSGTDGVFCGDAEAGTNACGGCQELNNPLGVSCGECLGAVWSCDGPENVACLAPNPHINACGGCQDLGEQVPGELCGTTPNRTRVCQSDGKLTCEVYANGCGGNAFLVLPPGAGCSECGLSGSYECTSENATACVVPNLERNVCGGCDALPGPSPGSACGPCGFDAVECDGTDGTRCNGQTACPAVAMLSASQDREDAVLLSWQSRAGALGYQVRRDGVVVAEVAGDVTAFLDLEASASIVQAPGQVTASQDRSDMVRLSWRAPVVTTFPHSYTVQAYFGETYGYGAASMEVLGQRAAAEVTGYEVRINGQSWLHMGAGLTYSDTSAPEPTVVAGAATASDALYVDRVVLSASLGTAYNGVPVDYEVRAVSSGGNGMASEVVYGYRAAGPLTYDWQRACPSDDVNGGATSPENWERIGQTSLQTNDLDPPVSGEQCQYRIAVAALGAQTAYSLMVPGARAVPSLQGLGTLSASRIAGSVAQSDVRLVNQYGANLALAGIPVSLGINKATFGSGVATLESTTNALGEASFSWSVNKADTGYTLMVTSSSPYLAGDFLESGLFAVTPSTASLQTSAILATGGGLADGVDAASINIVLRDEFSNAISGVVPTFEATDGPGRNGNAYLPCSATNSAGTSSCTMTTTMPGVKTVGMTSPLSLLGNAVTFTRWQPRYWFNADGQINSIVHDTQHVYVGGTFTTMRLNTGRFAVVDTTTGLPSVLDRVTGQGGNILAIVADGDGGWFVGGSFPTVAGVNQPRLARILANGQMDPNWLPGIGDGEVMALLLDGARLYVGGSFTQVNGVARRNLVALNAATGATDETWAGAGNANTTAVYALAMDTDNIYVGGQFTSIGASPVARNHLAFFARASGAVVDLAANVVGTAVYALALDGSTLYVGGNFTNIGGTNRRNLAAIASVRDAPSVSSWAPMTNNGNGIVRALAVDPLATGLVYFGGEFTAVANNARNYAAAANKSGAVQGWNPNLNGVVQALALDDNRVYIGGQFTSVANPSAITRTRLAAVNKTDGAVVSGSDPYASDTVFALAVDGTRLGVGGAFNVVGNAPRNRIARMRRVDGGLDPTFTGGVTGGAGAVNALALMGGVLYVGGDFASAVVGQSTPTRNHLAAFNVLDSSLTSWVANATGGNVLAVHADGTHIYVGGNFTQINGSNRNRLAAMTPEGGLRSNWAPSPGATVRTLTSNASVVVVGGDFTGWGEFLGAGGRDRLAAVNKSDGATNDWVFRVDNSVRTTAFVGNYLVAGGDFGNIAKDLQNSSRTRLATWDGVPGALTNWNPTAGGSVHAVAVNATHLFVAGSFTTLGGGLRDRVGAILRNAQGVPTTLAGWSPNSDGTVNALDVDGPYVYLGGAFANVNGESVLGGFAAVEIPD